MALTLHMLIFGFLVAYAIPTLPPPRRINLPRAPSPACSLGTLPTIVDIVASIGPLRRSSSLDTLCSMSPPSHSRPRVSCRLLLSLCNHMIFCRTWYRRLRSRRRSLCHARTSRPPRRASLLLPHDSPSLPPLLDSLPPLLGSLPRAPGSLPRVSGSLPRLPPPLGPQLRRRPRLLRRLRLPRRLPRHPTRLLRMAPHHVRLLHRLHHHRRLRSAASDIRLHHRRIVCSRVRRPEWCSRSPYSIFMLRVSLLFRRCTVGRSRTRIGMLR